MEKYNEFVNQIKEKAQEIFNNTSFPITTLAQKEELDKQLNVIGEYLHNKSNALHKERPYMEKEQYNKLNELLTTLNNEILEKYKAIDIDVDFIIQCLQSKIDSLFINVNVETLTDEEIRELQRTVLKIEIDNCLTMEKLLSNNYLSDKDYAIHNYLKKTNADLKERVFAISHKPLSTKNNMSLYKIMYHGEREIYYIYDTTTKELLGEISYSDNPEYVENYGNIGFNINQKHRGHNYSLQALELLSNHLYERGIREIKIYSRDTNVASKRIAEKFTGVKEPTKHPEKNIWIYSCNLGNNKYIAKK